MRDYSNDFLWPFPQPPSTIFGSLFDCCVGKCPPASLRGIFWKNSAKFKAGELVREYACCGARVAGFVRILLRQCAVSSVIRWEIAQCEGRHGLVGKQCSVQQDEEPTLPFTSERHWHPTIKQPPQRSFSCLQSPPHWTRDYEPCLLCEVKCLQIGLKLEALLEA